MTSDRRQLAIGSALISAQIKELRAGGYTIAAIAGAVGISARAARDAVSRMIDTGEVQPRFGAWTPAQEQAVYRMASDGRSDQDIAAVTGRTVLAVHRKRARMGYVKRRLWTAAEEASLAELVASRKTDVEIAEALGRPVWGVIERRRRLGLRRRAA